MLSQVHGKRFVYKFVCDLKMLLGYTAAELSRLVGTSEEISVVERRQPHSSTSRMRTAFIATIKSDAHAGCDSGQAYRAADSIVADHRAADSSCADCWLTIWVCVIGCCG